MAIKDKFLVQAFQHGEKDRCEAAVAFETYDEALAYAKSWEIPYDNDTEHEIVIFEARDVVRFKITAKVLKP